MGASSRRRKSGLSSRPERLPARALVSREIRVKPTSQTVTKLDRTVPPLGRKGLTSGPPRATSARWLRWCPTNFAGHYPVGGRGRASKRAVRRQKGGGDKHRQRRNEPLDGSVKRRRVGERAGEFDSDAAVRVGRESGGVGQLAEPAAVGAHGEDLAPVGTGAERVAA